MQKWGHTKIWGVWTSLNKFEGCLNINRLWIERVWTSFEGVEKKSSRLSVCKSFIFVLRRAYRVRRSKSLAAKNVKVGKLYRLYKAKLWFSYAQRVVIFSVKTAVARIGTGRFSMRDTRCSMLDARSSILEKMKLDIRFLGLLGKKRISTEEQKS